MQRIKASALINCDGGLDGIAWPVARLRLPRTPALVHPHPTVNLAHWELLAATCRAEAVLVCLQWQRGDSALRRGCGGWVYRSSDRISRFTDEISHSFGVERKEVKETVVFLPGSRHSLPEIWGQRTRAPALVSTPSALPKSFCSPFQTSEGTGSLGSRTVRSSKSIFSSLY